MSALEERDGLRGESELAANVGEARSRRQMGVTNSATCHL